MKISIFYSWQSDLPNNTNRSLIQHALQKAVTSIKTAQSLLIEPCLERDTDGVPGTPEIASTIFRKIDECRVFVGDVSIINCHTTERKTPNPNVLLELGYAAKSLGWDYVICVFNTAFGEIENLPFDLRTRRIARYSVSENKENKAASRDELAEFFQKALQPILLQLDREAQEVHVPKPLTPEQATANVKKFLADERHRIELNDRA